MLFANKTKRPSYFKTEDGTTAVEFALIAIAFLALIFGIFEGGRMFWTLNTMQYAVESGARYALTNTDAPASEIADETRGAITGITVTNDNPLITVEFSTVNEVNFVQIDAVYTFQAVMPFLPDSWTSMDLTARSRLPVPDL